MRADEQKALEAHILDNHSPGAVYGYRRIIRQYINCLGDDAAKRATYRQITAYIGLLREQGMHPKTLRNHLYAIKMYYQWLVDSGQRDDHPCRELYLKDKINRAIPVETLFTKAELGDILQSYTGKLPLTRNRDRIILSLLVHQAITVYEIIHLKTGDIDFTKGTINVAGSVKTKPRELPLKPQQVMLLNHYLEHTRPLFALENKQPTVQDREALLLSRRGNRMAPLTISGIFKQPLSNGQKITAQKIRQSAIAHLLKTGNDLRVVQAFTGHKRVSSVEEYRQTGLEELKTAINRFHPLQ
jgi:integrase/recombinase XerD